MVTIVRIEGDRVRVGITAPADVRVVRAELLEAVASQNLQAARRPAAVQLPPWPGRA